MPRKRLSNRLFIGGLVPVVVVVGTAGYFLIIHNANPVDKMPATSPMPGPSQVIAPVFDKIKYSTDQPDSHWVVVNKKRPLPANYVPPSLATNTLGGQLRPEVSKALDSLTSASRNDGIVFKMISAYRSYGSQSSVYNGYVQSDGQTNADTYSARPGHSEHQTGLAADLGALNGSCDLETCFGDTPAGQWLAAHAHEHGFIIRYQQNKESIVGYQYEPWHIRFVGVELATELVKTGQTMEEFFDLPPAPNY